MVKYRIDAEISVDDGPWEPYWMKTESTERDLPTTRKAAWKVKDGVALTRTGKDLSRVKVRNARVTDLDL